MDFHIIGGGGGGNDNCSRKASLGQIFSLLFSDNFLSPVTDNLLYLNEWKSEKKIHERMCGTQVSISSLHANEGDMLLTQLQIPMFCHGQHAILCSPNRFNFGNTIFFAFSGPTE